MTATGSEEASSHLTPLHAVLYQPEIPQNTGNIGRTCVAIGAKLWIVRPAGFRLDSTRLKRAGLDYWQDLDWEVVDGWSQLLERLPQKNLWLVTKFGSRKHFEATFAPGDVFVFGSETNGLPKTLRNDYPERQIQIPMPGPVRSLNQATSAGVVLYEAARQIGLLSGASPITESV